MWGAGTRWGAASARELKVNRSIRRKRPSGLSPAPEKRQTGLHTRGVMANEGPVDASELRPPHCPRVRTLPARGRPSRHRRTRASQRLPVSTDVFADPRTEWRCRFADGRHPHASGRAIPHQESWPKLTSLDSLRASRLLSCPLCLRDFRICNPSCPLPSGKAAADKHQLSSALNL